MIALVAALSIAQTLGWIEAQKAPADAHVKVDQAYVRDLVNAGGDNVRPRREAACRWEKDDVQVIATFREAGISRSIPQGSLDDADVRLVEYAQRLMEDRAKDDRIDCGR
jgi:hypothetical protein